MNKKKYITRQLVASCTPNQSFYAGEYCTYVEAILRSIANSLDVKHLSENQVERVFKVLATREAV